SAWHVRWSGLVRFARADALRGRSLPNQWSWVSKSFLVSRHLRFGHGNLGGSYFSWIALSCHRTNLRHVDRRPGALFAGPSGTGKTIAEVMARELGLDLYKIDLST